MYIRVLFSILGLTAAIVPTMTAINAVDSTKDQPEQKAVVAEKLRVAKEKAEAYEAASRAVEEATSAEALATYKATARAALAYLASAYRVYLAAKASEAESEAAAAEYKEAELSVHVIPEIAKIISSYTYI